MIPTLARLCQPLFLQIATLSVEAPEQMIQNSLRRRTANMSANTEMVKSEQVKFKDNS